MCGHWCRFAISLDIAVGKRIEETFVATDSSRRAAPPPPASDGTTGVYGITVAAELAAMSVQALRLYERKGLLEPARTEGGTRRYSDTDIARLRRISVLIADGINLTGIARVLGLEADNAGLRTRNADLRTSNAALRASNTELEADNTALRAPSSPER
jgi:DNA-binding transcriptional MerR regulator